MDLKNKLCLLILFLIFCIDSNAQRTGIPNIRNYSPGEYDGFAQNWAAEQDNRGVMYFANGKGILEYDGKNWRRFFTEKRSTVLSMGKDSEGRIYIGGESEIGYLAPDSSGLVSFVSLTNLIPEEDQTFSYVWHVYSSPEGVYFVTPEKLIRIKGNECKVWTPKDEFFTSFYSGGNLYIIDTKTGMNVMKGDSLHILPDGNRISDIRAAFSHGDTVVFVGRISGFTKFYNDTTLERFFPESEEYLRNYSVYKGVQLPGNRVAFATFNGGILVTNNKGEIIYSLSEEQGLQVSSVYALYCDREGELWAMLSNGISRIEVSSPLSYFNKTNGLNGIVQQISNFDNTLFVASLSGQYIFRSSPIESPGYERPFFEHTDNKQQQLFQNCKIGDTIFTSGGGGIWGYYQGKSFLFYNSAYTIAMTKSQKYSNTFFAGGVGEVYAVTKKETGWSIVPLYGGGNQEFHFIAEQDSSSVWCGTTLHGILRISYSELEDTNISLTWYDTLKGLPEGMHEVLNIDGKIISGTMKGLYVYNEQTDRFEPYTEFGPEFNKHLTYVLSPDNHGNLWMLKGTGLGILDKQNGYKWNETPFLRLKDIFNDYYSIHAENEDTCWIGGTDGIVLFENNNYKKYETVYAPVLSMVHTGRDTLFLGAFVNEKGYIANEQTMAAMPKLEYRDNSLTFYFATPFFDAENWNMHSYMLEGFDTSFSQWRVLDKKEYTNLPEGSYTFRVRAINIYGCESAETTFRFEIYPPWYRTYWAYFLYIIVGAFLIYTGMQLNTRRLRAAKRKLEEIVLQRTAEIRKQNQEILQQKEEIETQRDQIEGQRDRLIEQNEEIMQAKEEIEAQRDEIEAQRDVVTGQRDQIALINEEITSSIEYAKRIQKAIMPEELALDEMLKDSFIYLKPRDIVSGDFFWFRELRAKEGKHLIITAADCTGHGVPGAFMSMLGISFLAEIANSIGESMISSGEIVNRLRSHIITSLQHTGTKESEVKDGMDLSLCLINLDKKTVQYTGANNPLYLIRDKKENAPLSDPSLMKILEVENREVVLYEIKPDKMPVGVYYKDNADPFLHHTIELIENDRLYMFSDGFADQFGGPEGKKYKYKPFKELLLQTRNMDLKSQKKYLDSEFANWINQKSPSGEKQMQIDDVLIIGIQIF